jgi:NAD(P)-dependent dehydrogenase (short-subunit alcohol dehydrogenase family)
MTESKVQGWIVLTGAAGHLGKEIASGIVKAGGRVFATDVLENTTKLAAMQDSFKPGRFKYSTGNLSDDTFLADLIDTAGEECSPLMGLVNNAAYVGTSKILGWGSEFGPETLSAWNAVIHLNLTVPLILSQGLSQHFQPDSSIVNIGSVYGIVAPSWQLYEDTSMINPAAYGVSKAGLIQLTRWLSSVMSPVTRVNCVSPGGIERAGQTELFRQRYVEMTHLKSMATEANVASAVMFLLSPNSGYVTGTNLLVDGGFTAS